MNGIWGSGDIPRLDGRMAIVTGASSGVGYEIGLQLAARGAHVALASRDEDRTRRAAHRIRTALSGASVEARGGVAMCGEPIAPCGLPALTKGDRYASAN